MLVIVTCALFLAFLPAMAQSSADTTRRNDALVKKVLASVAGREAEPAGQVFKNIRLEGYEAVPVKQFLLVMNLGFSQALGVTCEHCHAVNDFASDDKRPKLAAREMAIMLRQIAERLEKMTSLATPPDKRGINCATSHRGNIIPRAKPAP